MIDDVEARRAPEIVDGAEIEQHRVSLGFEGFQARAQLRRATRSMMASSIGGRKLVGSIAAPAIGGVCVLGMLLASYARAKMPPRPPSRICC